MVTNKEDKMQRELKKILLVEDEPDIREITKSTLELVGNFEVETADNGLEGIAKVQAFMPDLILMDMMMPGMNGATALTEIRKIDSVKHIPVVFMTAKVQQHEIREYISLGALDVISKPFDPMQLSDQVTLIWQNFNA